MIPARGFQGTKVAVFGLGRTGLTAARSLKAGGAEAVLWDENADARAKALAEGFTVADLAASDWSDYQALLLSPGVPLTHPKPHWTVDKAKAAGVEIVGDIEVFARTVNTAPSHKRPKVAAITGSNGKSTTTALLGHVCARAGKDARVGGNIGVGVLDLDDMHGGAVYVLELSSYQLDLTSSLKPDAAVLLNISPDHLERHGGMEGYIASKRRVLLNQGKGDTAVIGVDDPWCQQICTEITAANRRTIRMISAQKSLGRGVYALQGVLYDATGDRVVEVCDLTRARSLPGRHNWQNAAAAYAAARALGVAPEDAAQGLMTFPGLAHRMETVGQLGKVRFVNDSKATNADAARQALSSYPKVYWIAGGQPKAGGIESLTDLFGRVGIGLGGCGLQITAHRDFGAAFQCVGELAGSIPDQVSLGDAAASGEDAVVLLSPAGASFDHFADFEARGEAFRTAVHDLAKAPARGATG